jgi:hypothetical protein
MFALKLVLTPLLIGLASMASRRWGSTVGGWLIGLPLTSAPVVFFLALDQGTTFAAHVAQGTLMGDASQAAFCVVYSWLSFRWRWLGCWLAGWGTFFVATLIFDHVALSLPLAFVGTIILLLVALLLLPRQRGKSVEARPPRWDIVGRMVVATAFVIALTGSAPWLGPRLSGLLSPLPIFATVFAIFTQHFQGSAAARQVLRGVLVSSFACAVFFLVVAASLERWGIFATFCAAILAALLVQGCALWLLKTYGTPALEKQQSG